MKRAFLISIPLIVIVMIAGAIVMRKQSSTTKALADLKPFATKDSTFYYDPSEFLKTMPAAMKAKIKMDLTPMQVHFLCVKKADFDKISQILHQDLLPTAGWSFAPTTTMPKDFAKLSMTAYKGPASTGLPPGHNWEVTVFPNFDYNTQPPRKIKYFQVTETRRLAPWEVLVLKARNLGRNPYVKVEDVGKLMSE